MLPKRLITCICFVGIAFNCLAQYETLLHKTHSQRYKQLQAFSTDTVKIYAPEIVLPRIDALEKLAADKGDDELRMEAQLLKLEFFAYRSYPPAKVFSILNSIRAKALKNKWVWAQAKTEQVEAYYNFFRQQYEIGFEHYQKLYELIKDVPASQLPEKQDLLGIIADNYYFFSDFREAIVYNLKALEAEPDHAIHPYPRRLSILNTLGLGYQQLHLLDSSDHYFFETITLARSVNNVVWEGIASGNLGYNYFLRKEYDKALPMLEKDVKIAVDNADWGLAAGSLMVAANIHIERKDYVRAAIYVQTAREYVARSQQYERLKHLYPLLSKLSSVNGQPEKAIVYLDSAIAVRDSLDRRLSSLQMLRASQKVALEQYKAETILNEGKRKMYLLQRNVLVAAILLMMAAVVYAYRQYRKRSGERQEQLIRAEQELEAASKQLHDFTRNISEKNALIEMLEQRNDTESAEVLQQLQQKTILTDEDWAYFRDLFEKAHPGFFQRMKEKVPGLTPAETRFMALSKLNLSTKEMAGMLGIGTDAVRKSRSRIRKKLNIGEEESLEDLIVSI